MGERLNCVLIVDDDHVSNYVTESVLRGMGVSSMINTVSDGQSALEYIRYQCEEDSYTCPDLIILDINMRLVNGLEFVKKYRKIKTKNKSVIIILSALPLKKEQKQELEKLGVIDFYVKPLNAEKLANIMNEYFSLSKH
jgi:CheY-like chemotaxis protein